MTKTTTAKGSDGQQMVLAIMEWMLTFLAMPREYALVAVLFAINSYWFKAFDSCPYLSIVAATKQSGKTSFLETIAALCKGGEVVQNITEPTLFHMIADNDGWAVPCMDEFELRDDDMGQTLNGGYRSTGSATRTNRGAKDGEPTTIRYSTFCQKAFACIGDVTDTLRDRSIPLVMTRARAARKYRYSEMFREASAYRAGIAGLVHNTFPRNAPTLYDCEWLSGRDEEIWMPLFTTAKALQFDDAMMELLTLTSKRLTRAKSAEAMAYTQRQVAEDKAADKTHGEALLLDLLKVCGDESKVWTATIIERLHSREGWDTFRGTGLSAMNLSELLSPFGIAPAQIKIKGKNQNGYDVARIREAAKRNNLL